MDDFQRKYLAAGLAAGGAMLAFLSLLRHRSELDSLHRRVSGMWIRPGRVTELEQSLRELKRRVGQDERQREELSRRIDRLAYRGTR